MRGYENIPRNEYELLSTAITRILSTEILERNMSDKIPLIDDLTDANKIYCGKVSVLFVDMRESSKLTDRFNTNQLVKIYRSYIRSVVQAIRYSGGVVRDFMGDGILAVFVDDDEFKCEDKAVHAARYIATAVDKFLNPMLDQLINHRISCGIGIHTGDISLSKVGMKGKEQSEEFANEFGIVWIGNSTNLACKFSSAVDCSTIFISSSTYAALSEIEGKKNWEGIEIVKGNHVLNGYISKQYYLELDDHIEPCVGVSNRETLSLADVLKNEYKKHVNIISIEIEELIRKKQEYNEIEQKLKTKIHEVKSKEDWNFTKELTLNRMEYEFHCKVLNTGHCKSKYVKEMGQDFWEEHLKDAIESGAKIGKDEHKVKQEISYAMVSIYRYLEAYDRAYDFLVEQATGYSWLNLSVVQDIIRRVGYCDRLKSALLARIAKNNLSSGDKIEFERIKDWLLEP